MTHRDLVAELATRSFGFQHDHPVPTANAKTLAREFDRMTTY
jgi:hypothetical protein